MGASQERVAIWHETNIDELRELINKFITKEVSKVVDLRINSIEEKGWETTPDEHYETAETVHYAYLRYIPQ